MHTRSATPRRPTPGTYKKSVSWRKTPRAVGTGLFFNSFALTRGTQAHSSALLFFYHFFLEIPLVTVISSRVARRARFVAVVTQSSLIFKAVGHASNERKGGESEVVSSHAKGHFSRTWRLAVVRQLAFSGTVGIRFVVVRA